MRFMLCASMDTKDHSYLDEEKYVRIQALEDSGLWIEEEKYDGERLQIDTVNGKHIVNRRDKEYTQTHHTPEFERIMNAMPTGTAIDGEGIVYCKPELCQHNKTCQGKIGHACRLFATSRFGSKMNFSQALIEKFPAYFAPFELRWLNGVNIENEPLEYRKQKLKELCDDLQAKGVTNLVYAPHIEKGFVELFKRCPEGVVAKRKGSRYIPMDEGNSQGRPMVWFKIKHLEIRTVDVQGYSLDAEGHLSNIELRNLILTENGVYRGTAGGGFNYSEREQVKKFLDKFPSQVTPYSISQHLMKKKHRFKYIPNTGMKAVIAFQEVLPSGIFYCLRMLKLIYPQNVAVANEEVAVANEEYKSPIIDKMLGQTPTSWTEIFKNL